ncbi:MAG: T9SS type A sorting domain-containing protein [Bacteroidetes bacterium]|nr:T9SS type A sorting domain-containing protein [Bacteroidota bacterium]
MNIFKTYFWLLIFISKFLFAQTVSLRKITKLPSQVSETSGIVAIDKSTFFTINDSGNEPKIYRIDTFGNVLKTIFIKNAVNIDWEDITQDQDSNLYIGDFGNNENTRTDLKIYKIKNPYKLSNDTSLAETINFYYPNQNLFPPPLNYKIFDAEAFISFNKYLYIFSKNNTSPFTGYTYLYKIPTKPGLYKAQLLDSFKTGEGLKELWWVTSAALSPDFKKLLLLSSNKIFAFSEFENDSFFRGKPKTIDLEFISQKEAISFTDNDNFFITDEYNSIFEGMNLYSGSLAEIYKTSVIGNLKNLVKKVNVGENDSGITVYLADLSFKIQIFLSDLSGRKIESGMLSKQNPSLNFEIPLGIYYITLTDGTSYQHLKFVKYK